MFFKSARNIPEPIHELSVCVAPMYGNEPSWLPIIDFVEHNKLEVGRKN